MGLLKSLLGKSTERQNYYNYNAASYKEMEKANAKYYNGLDKIESMWSVMYNLKSYEGSNADKFETICYESIKYLGIMINAQKNANYGNSIPLHVPAYVRLAMLYEKREDYEKAINICADAIRAGFINDGNKGKMYGRLARLIHKSGINVDSNISKLIEEK